MIEDIDVMGGEGHVEVVPHLEVAVGEMVTFVSVWGDNPLSNMSLDARRRTRATLGILVHGVVFKRDIDDMTISWMMWRHGLSGVISSN